MKYIYFTVIAVILSFSAYAENQKDMSGMTDISEISVLKEELHKLKLELEIVKGNQGSVLSGVNKNSSEISNAQKSIIEGNVLISKKLEESDKRSDSLESKISHLKSEQNILDRSIQSISIAWSQSSSLAKLGALILLTGLLIEIVGATVLAGTHLVTEQKDVYTLKSTPSLVNMGMKDVNSEPRIDFLGSIASVMLFTGFVLQFSGTILVLSLPNWLSALMVVLAIIPGALVIYYLLGQSYNQSRSQKLKIIIGNIKRNLIPVFGARCSICSKKVKFDNAHVFWNLEPNSEKHPYLHTPYKMHFGHEKCLLSSGYYEQPKKRRDDQKDIEIYKMNIREFFEQAPKMKAWWSDYRAHWAERRDSEESLSYSEYVFLHVQKEILKLKPNKHLHSDHLSAPPSLQDGA